MFKTRSVTNRLLRCTWHRPTHTTFTCTCSYHMTGLVTVNDNLMTIVRHMTVVWSIHTFPIRWWLLIIDFSDVTQQIYSCHHLYIPVSPDTWTYTLYTQVYGAIRDSCIKPCHVLVLSGVILTICGWLWVVVEHISMYYVLCTANMAHPSSASNR